MEGLKEGCEKVCKVWSFNIDVFIYNLDFGDYYDLKFKILGKRLKKEVYNYLVNFKLFRELL